MSQNKRPDLSSNQTIREAIQKIAWRGMASRTTGAVKGTGKISGYVAKIHDDGELAGTIDVQEYTSLSMNEEVEMVGYHEGVLLSAIQDNRNGYVIIPKLYSEVLVSQDPETGAEYVSMFSHVDMIQLDSHETITIGVKEREEFDMEDEDSPDIDELQLTGVMSKTTYTKDAVVTEVRKTKDAHTSMLEVTGEKISASVDDNKTSFIADKEKVQVKRDKAEVIVQSDKITESVGSSSVTIEGGKVHIGSTSGTDNAVLGTELASILSEFMGLMGKMVTTTAMGPQPPVNVASFVALKAKIDAFKASKTGFLTQKVMIQK